jgi:hypothetical protein
MWCNNRLITSTFTSHHPDNAYANIEGVGWRKMKAGNPSGVTNMLTLCSLAVANSRRTNVELSDADGEILTVYLL